MNLDKVEEHIETINGELGDLFEAVAGIRGELKWISIIIIGTFLATITQLVLDFLG